MQEEEEEKALALESGLGCEQRSLFVHAVLQALFEEWRALPLALLLLLMGLLLLRALLMLLPPGPHEFDHLPSADDDPLPVHADLLSVLMDLP